MRVLFSLCLVVVITLASAGVAHTAPVNRDCPFRASIWRLVQRAAEYTGDYWYQTTDTLDTGKARLDAKLQRKLARYDYPPGYLQLEAAWKEVWDHLRMVVHWHTIASAQPNLSAASRYLDKLQAEQYAASGSMQVLWRAARAMC
jgi:hypothetical protein